jgi:hypothetical protein
MADYIVLNGKRFRALQKAWQPSGPVPATVRVTLHGDLDITFGPRRLKNWIGQLVAPNTADPAPTDGSGETYGTAADLRTLLDFKAAVTFKDHLGVTYNPAGLIGSGRERSLLPDWDNPGNKFYIEVEIVA